MAEEVLSAKWSKAETVWLLRSWYFWTPLAIAALVSIILAATGVGLQWQWLVIYGGLFCALSPFAKGPGSFFRGIPDADKSKVSLMLLAGSAFISWVFAKSVFNSASLGAAYGVVGGLGYAAYYTAFPSVAIVIYVLRGRGIQSLPEAIAAHYGPLAALSFALAVLYRLFNEVWSNSLVVASFYGEYNTTSWWLAVVLSTAVPLAYVELGGMRSSLVSDVVQAMLALVMLIITLICIGSKAPTNLWHWNAAGTCDVPPSSSVVASSSACLAAGGPAAQSLYVAGSCNYATISNATVCTDVGGMWTASSCVFSTELTCDQAGGDWAPRKRMSLQGGWDFLVLGLLQGMFSYGFFDPVLTDRCFLANRRTALLAYLIGGSVAAAFIFIYSFFGIYGSAVAALQPASEPPNVIAQMAAGVPSAIAKSFGTAVFSITNIIFITSSVSTLDSTFASTSKLVGLELISLLRRGRPNTPQQAQQVHVWLGRIAMLVMAVVGTLPLLANPKALDATTVSGTMVVGLGPPVIALMFFKGYNPLMFHLPFWSGVGFGIVYALATNDCCRDKFNVKGWAVGDGDYALLLGFNLIAMACCWGLCVLAWFDMPLTTAWRSTSNIVNHGLPAAVATADVVAKAGVDDDQVPDVVVTDGTTAMKTLTVADSARLNSDNLQAAARVP